MGIRDLSYRDSINAQEMKLKFFDSFTTAFLSPFSQPHNELKKFKTLILNPTKSSPPTPAPCSTPPSLFQYSYDPSQLQLLSESFSKPYFKSLSPIFNFQLIQYVNELTKKGKESSYLTNKICMFEFLDIGKSIVDMCASEDAYLRLAAQKMKKMYDKY
ncbi:unnamed protein product [Vicia faba]|uniref:Uncharacterized protein n=1 Tax=Vicia faba TaxID=3906 RepID=A0AAV1AIL3_VICFA|nr:unnamed protein product [Vicia faba]